MTYYEQIADKEALLTLIEGIDINTLLRRDVWNKNLTIYDTWWK